MTVGCAWLLREIELAALQVDDIKFTAGQGCGEATVRIWSSKTDSAALGVDRTLPCLCPNPWCPVKAIRNLTERLPKNQQVLRTWSGEPVTKRMFVDALKEYAGLTGSEEIARITGRSMRVTGAQMMRLAGFDVEQVKLLGRWQNTAQLFPSSASPLHRLSCGRLGPSLNPPSSSNANHRAHLVSS